MTNEPAILEIDPTWWRGIEDMGSNRNIEIKERERKRVEIFMGMIAQNEKTLVFCATQDHALFVRDCINQILYEPAA